MAKIYAGIGSRSTPEPILKIIRNIAYKLAQGSWTVRSGFADGADQAFSDAVHQFKYDTNTWDAPLQEVYLPWEGFNGLYTGDIPGVYCIENDSKADELAAKFHPAYSRLSKNVKRLITRNGYQVLGSALNDPVKFVLVWTSDGSLDGLSRESGGSGHALRIATHYRIPVYNLARDDHFIRLTNWLKE